MSDARKDRTRSPAVAGDERSLTRRGLLRAGGVGALVMSGGVWFGGTGCSPPGPRCFDPELLSTPERALREAQAYRDPSPHGEAQRCDGCQFFRSQDDTGCGRCQILAGAVSATAHCKAWARAIPGDGGRR